MYLKELLEAIHRKKKMESVSTSKLMKYVEAESAIFERDRHQDCHEFYIWLMNSINDQLKGKDKKKATPLEEEFFSKRVTRTECSVCKTSTPRDS
jgi:ubiquitin C-terminal hydrolase